MALPVRRGGYIMRVILADDEQKVCQLIYDLVHWEDYGMTVVGMAYNGLDTLDLIKNRDLTW